MSDDYEAAAESGSDAPSCGCGAGFLCIIGARGIVRRLSRPL